MTLNDFSERLSDLRLQKNVSSREMSLYLGHAQGYINNIENGKSFPSFTCFFEICDYLGISPKDFFDLETEAPQSMRELIAAAAKLPPEKLEHLIVIAKDLRES